MNLPSTINSKLSKLLVMLGSDRDGEVVAAARSIQRVLRSCGRDLHDLARKLTGNTAEHHPPSPEVDREMVRWCLAADNGRLTDRERQFLHGLGEWLHHGQPSAKQRAWLRDIHNRLDWRD